ncbi:MAG TPA: diacylglycerol kinase family protein [Gemmatimonadaceae bacterium]|nr:diacylglycerol kinase family protein [Gemmatimonadaceae bacterium]
MFNLARFHGASQRNIVTNWSLLYESGGFSGIVRPMKKTTACLVVHPRSGKNLARVNDVLAVLAKAGWVTDVVVKDEKGKTMELAARAAEAGYDFVVAYGGDGTVNHVINGVLAFSGKRPAAVGVIPGGTANVWAAEVGIPTDPARAAQSLVESDVRTVDVGHVGVESLLLGAKSSDFDRHAASAGGARRHFLLMAGLGADASLMGAASPELKHKLGVAAVVLAAMKMLPTIASYPATIYAGDSSAPLWTGRALQIVVGNTRLYGKITKMTPEAQIDSGELDLGVLTARSKWSALMQVITLLVRGGPAHSKSVRARAVHWRLTAPANVDLQLDGSAVKLKKYLNSAARDALARAGDPSKVMVNYRFDAVPAALRIAVPRDYNGALFSS